MRNLIALLLVTLCSSFVIAQSQELYFIVAAEDSKEVIRDVNVFIANGNIASATNAKGRCKISIPTEIKSKLILSHLGYDYLELIEDEYRSIGKGDTVWMTPNGFVIEEVVIASKTSKKWKKRYKRFEKALLGESKAANSCIIKNPQVLVFGSKDGLLTVYSKDLLQIENNYLGYDLQFLLTGMTIDKKGGSSYQGFGYFEDQEEVTKAQMAARNVSDVFSLRTFFKRWINDQAAFADSYQIKETKYQSGRFSKLVSSLGPSMSFDSLSDVYIIQFKEYLEVEHLDASQEVRTFSDKRLSSVESTKFSNSQSGAAAQIVHPKSYLFCSAPYLIVDRQGRIVNASNIKEYGFWANQKLAVTLPDDYGYTYGKRMEPILVDELKLLKTLLYGKPDEQRKQLIYLRTNWKRDYISPLLEIVRMSNDQHLVEDLRSLLVEMTGQESMSNYYDGLAWVWKEKLQAPSYLLDFKAELYRHIDKSFYRYFNAQQGTAEIDPTEIVWGGVKQDGIPPLRLPKMIEATNADYLDDDDVIFGLNINGEAKAYPKRILGWHEMVVDKVGGETVAGVYCTLCGTMIAYDMRFQNQLHALGTSGFLYRSNKLMYDKQTHSLWSTLLGKPVLGPLVGKGIELDIYTVYTTTWGEWKKLYPETMVLDVETGYKRDYREGEAYKKYYSSDQLMFPVPRSDRRLRNKDQVVVLRGGLFDELPIAFDLSNLHNKQLVNGSHGGVRYTVTSTKEGMVDAFLIEDPKVKFSKYNAGGNFRSDDGRIWTITEEGLESEEVLLPRIQTHQVFWFAWVNARPNTVLVK